MLQRIEGLWWKHNANVTGFVSLSNTTAQALNAKLQISGADGASLGEYPLLLSPHVTQVVDLIELLPPSATAGGVELTYNAPTDSVLVSGGLQDIKTGYSAAIPFLPYTPLNSDSDSKMTTLTELGLMTGASDPMMLFPAGTAFTPFSVFRNISKEPVILMPEVFWMDQGTTHRNTAAPLTIKASETLLLDTNSLLQQTGLSDFNGVLNLTFKTKASPHALMMASGSVDHTGTYVFQVQPHAVGESMSKNISYWSVGKGDDTMVTVWNPADEPQDFLFTLQYGTGGRYTMPLHLPARASRFFNISSLIHDQIPDSQGRVIPNDITEGSAVCPGYTLRMNSFWPISMQENMFV